MTSTKRSSGEMMKDEDNNNNNMNVIYKTRVVFKVADFAKELDTNWTLRQVITSNMFTIGSDKWMIKIQCDSDDSVGLYLRLCKSKTLPVETSCVMYIIDNENQKHRKREFRKTFDCIGSCGKHLIIRQHLLNNRNKLLNDNNNNNTLTVGFDITVRKSQEMTPTPTTTSRRIKSVEETKRCRFGHLFGVRELSDCRLIVGEEGKVFFASKFVLSSQSVVFEKIFTTIDYNNNNGSKKKKKKKMINELVIKDISSDVFTVFLRYLYTGNCDKMDDMCDDMLLVADKYRIESLKTICLNLIFMQIHKNNALKTLKLMQDFGADDELMAKTNEFIAENITAVISQEFLDKYDIDWENIKQIVGKITKRLSKSKNKLMFYTYSYNE